MLDSFICGYYACMHTSHIETYGWRRYFEPKEDNQNKRKKSNFGGKFHLLYKRNVPFKSKETEVKEFTDKKFFMKSKVHITMGSFYVTTTSDQKQPFVDVLRNRCSLEFCKIHRKTPVTESLLIKFQGLHTCNYIKKRLQHRCFRVNIEKFVRTAFFIKHLQWLLVSDSYGYETLHT